MLSSANRLMPYYLQQNNISRNNHSDNFNTGFKDILSEAISKAEPVSVASAAKTLINNTVDVDSYLAQLRVKYGSKISVQSMEYSKANINHIGSSTLGTGNVIIAPNGEVTYYCSSDYTPEEKARLEKAMKEEDEDKAKKREEQKRLSEIATDRYLQMMSSTVPDIDRSK